MLRKLFVYLSIVLPCFGGGFTVEASIPKVETPVSSKRETVFAGTRYKLGDRLKGIDMTSSVTKGEEGLYPLEDSHAFDLSVNTEDMQNVATNGVNVVNSYSYSNTLQPKNIPTLTPTATPTHSSTSTPIARPTNTTIPLTQTLHLTAKVTPPSIPTSRPENSPTMLLTMVPTQVVLNPHNSITGLRTVQEWETLFLQSWENEHRYTYLPLSNSGNSWNYYNLAYAIDGLTAMYEATGNRKYLDRALSYIQNMIEDAKPSSSLPDSQFKDSYLAWSASNHPVDRSIGGGEYPLFESYCWRYVTKLLRVMRQNSALYNDPAYRMIYEDVLSFTQKNIFEKWMKRGSANIYRSRTHMASHWAFIALNLWLITTDETRRAQYWEVLDNINNHLPNYRSSLRQQMKQHPRDRSAYFWDSVWGSYSLPGQDIAHGNNVIAYLVEAHDQGVEWTDGDMQALSNLLLNVIWTQRESGYSYVDFVDGSGTGNGWFNDGFCKLGRYDERIQRLLEKHTVGRNMQLYGNGALNAKILALRKE